MIKKGRNIIDSRAKEPQSLCWVYDCAYFPIITWAHPGVQVRRRKVGGTVLRDPAHFESWLMDTSWSLFFLSSSCLSGLKEQRHPNLLTFPLWSTWTRTVWCVWVGALIITKVTLLLSWWSTQQAGWVLASVLMERWRDLISSSGESDPLEATLQ